MTKDDANERYMAVLGALGAQIEKNKNDLVFARYEIERLEDKLKTAHDEIERLRQQLNE